MLATDKVWWNGKGFRFGMTSTKIKNTKEASLLRKRSSEQSGTDMHKATEKKKEKTKQTKVIQKTHKELRIIPTERSEQSF